MSPEITDGSIYTAADEILDETSLDKYKAGDPYFVELYNQLNIIFPEKFRRISTSISRNCYDKTL